MSATGRHVLALDQGTTSSRAILYAEDGRVIARAQRELRQSYPRPGWVEHDPDEIVSGQLATAAEALARAGVGAHEVAAIGIAMGRSGTDVARDAADLVLLDDRFETIVDAVRQGRSTFADIRRSLTYHLTSNVAELAPFIVWALSGRRIPLVRLTRR